MWYAPTMALSRASISILYLRLTSNRMHRCLIYIVLTCTIVFGIMLILVFALQCRPVSYTWNKDQPGSCVDKSISVAAMYVYSGQSLFCDLLFAILPVFIIRGLRIDRNTKLGVNILLALGCVLVFHCRLRKVSTNTTYISASIAVIVRMTYIHTLSEPDYFCLWHYPTLLLRTVRSNTNREYHQYGDMDRC
jgi:hypothetical protein